MGGRAAARHRAGALCQQPVSRASGSERRRAERLGRDRFSGVPARRTASLLSISARPFLFFTTHFSFQGRRLATQWLTKSQQTLAPLLLHRPRPLPTVRALLPIHPFLCPFAHSIHSVGIAGDWREGGLSSGHMAGATQGPSALPTICWASGPRQAGLATGGWRKAPWPLAVPDHRGPPLPPTGAILHTVTLWPKAGLRGHLRFSGCRGIPASRPHPAGAARREVAAPARVQAVRALGRGDRPASRSEG